MHSSKFNFCSNKVNLYADREKLGEAADSPTRLHRSDG